MLKKAPSLAENYDGRDYIVATLKANERYGWE
jgi:hypothetical protein